MKEFYLYGNNHERLEIKPSFPKKELEKYGFPGAEKFHAMCGKQPILFQTIKVGEVEIANSDYLVRSNGKFSASSDESCIEIHFLLTGSVQINLNGFGWTMLDFGSHNLTTVPFVHSEVYFKSSPVSTFDIHIPEAKFTILAARYPKIARLLKAYRAKREAALKELRIKTNPLMLHLIVQIRIALRAGLENEPSTIAMVERLICMVIEEETIEPKNQFSYEDIEKIHTVYLQMGMNMDEKEPLANKIKDIHINAAKFREGFKLLFGYLPRYFLQEKRLEQAYKLATENRETTVAGIANLCGYDSSRYLSKAFLKRYGIQLPVILKKNRKKSNKY